MQNTIEQMDTNDFMLVNYVMEAKSKGQTSLHVNSNLYGYKDGKCIDIHVSQGFSDIKKIDFELLITFVSSLQYAELESNN